VAATSVPGEFSLGVDGETLRGDSPLRAERVLAGERVVTFRRQGFVVDRAWLYGAAGRQELTPVGTANDDAASFRIDLPAGSEVRVRFDLRQATGEGSRP
jgi:hypothetical protein